MRINVSVEDNLLKDFDEFCTKYRFERSEFISALMRATVYDDFTLQGARTVSRIVKKEQQKEVSPQEEVQSENGTPKKLGGDVVLREKIWEDRNLEEVVVPVSQGFCEGHFEKGKIYKRYLIAYENEHGVETLKKWLCERCKNNMIEKAKEVGTLRSTYE